MSSSCPSHPHFFETGGPPPRLSFQSRDCMIQSYYTIILRRMEEKYRPPAAFRIKASQSLRQSRRLEKPRKGFFYAFLFSRPVNGSKILLTPAGPTQVDSVSIPLSASVRIPLINGIDHGFQFVFRHSTCDGTFEIIHKPCGNDGFIVSHNKMLYIIF
mgnify:CR=1 FL=1